MNKKGFEGGTEEESEDASAELSDEELEEKSEEGEHEEYTYYELFAIVISYALVLLALPFSLIFCFRIVSEYEKAVIFRLGKLRLQDAIRGVVAVGDYKYATLLLAQAALRSISGERTLLELLSERREIMQLMHEALVRGTGPWGVVVERVEIKDIRLPVEMQRSMAAEAEANRVARAKVVSAEGEKIAANALKFASETISSSPGAIQMRYLQTLRSSVEGNSNICVLPISKEIHQLFRGLMSRLRG